VHDYLYQQGRTSVADGYWMPYVTPVALVSFALVLVHRLVQALGDVEQLNASLEVRVAERTRELETANAAKTRFLAAASHDMRQPVVTIGLLVGLVREQVASLPAVRVMIDRVNDAVASMEALLKGLMDLSRLESGTLNPRMQAIPLAALFEAIDLHEQPAAAVKGLRLRFRATPLGVLSDPVLLDQIVRNLVSNAVRYTERGGILVAARRRRNSVLLQVWDTGRGIPKQSQADVFEEFVQLDNPGRERSKGLGLGLAIVQRAARLLGHRIRLASVPGRGSCFTLELPLAPAGQTVPSEPVATALPLRDQTAWLIEDDSALREVLTLRLQRWGAHVEPFGSRAAVQERCDAGGSDWPALIVSDQRLPDGSGLGCIALVRARAGREVAAVVVTGDTSPSDLALLAEAGVPVLHKPFRGDELLALLQQVGSPRDASSRAMG
jgi:signal transduction histidine kinase/CheY-like chemotaxis protein